MKRKSIQEYIFRSNTIMIVVVMLCVMVFYGAAYTVYQFRNEPNVVKSSELATNTTQAYQLIQGREISTTEEMEALAQKLEEEKFYLLVTSSQGDVQYMNIEGLSAEDYRQIHEYVFEDGKIHTYVLSGMTMLTYASGENGMEVYAFNEENVVLEAPWKRIVRSMMYATVVLLLFILVLSVVSRFFMRRLSKRIMEPLQSLNEATERIKQENYTEKISYSGDYEFEEVCASFNDMQAQVAEARKQQKEYEKARTDMVAGISHDLRTPLTAIQGTLKGLIDGVAKTPQMQKKFLDTAFRRSVEMSQLLDQLFYFSKIETGNMPVHLQKLDWAEYLKEYMEKRRALNEENVTYYFHTTGDEICSEIDPREMSRILDNLVENSKKYAKTQELAIQFNLSRKEDRVYLWVSDNGEGVPEEKLPHIFEKFYRADESRNETEGNGLGLHIVKYLTEAMHGTVCAVNHDGLEIRFEFPAVKGEE